MSGKVFKGLDYQGRHEPEAAHAATGEGEDYSEPDGSGFVRGVAWCLVAWVAVSLVGFFVRGWL